MASEGLRRIAREAATATAYFGGKYAGWEQCTRVLHFSCKQDIFRCRFIGRFIGENFQENYAGGNAGWIAVHASSATATANFAVRPAYWSNLRDGGIQTAFFLRLRDRVHWYPSCKMRLREKCGIACNQSKFFGRGLFRNLSLQVDDKFTTPYF